MPSLDDILSQIDKLGGGVQEPGAKRDLGVLREQVAAFAKDQQDQQAQFQAKINEDQAEIARLNGSVSALQAQVTDLQNQVADLQKKLDTEVVVSRSTPLELANSLRNMIDQIQADARSAPEVGVTVKAMDIEVKGLLEVDQNQTSLVLPGVKAPVDPGALSTLRISFGAVPVAQPTTPTPTPSPAPTPTPSPAPPPTPTRAPPPGPTSSPAPRPAPGVRDSETRGRTSGKRPRGRRST